MAVVTVLLSALLIVTACGNEGEVAEVDEEAVYEFSFAYGMWDLSRGRIPVEEQVDSPYYNYVGEVTGAAPQTISWEWDGAEGYLRGLRLMLASGDLPDALKPYDVQLTKELIDEGVAIPLDDLLEEHGQNILAMLTESEWETVRSQSSDGQIYYIPEVNAADRYPVGLIRQDWLDRVGLPMPTTRDEFVEVLRAFRDQDANGDGDPSNEIPTSGRAGLRWLDDMFMMHGVSMFEGFPLWRWDEESGEMVSEQISDEMRESIDFLRMLYAEGLIDDVFVIQSASDWIAKISSSRVGHYFHLPSTLEIFSGFRENEPDARWAYMPPLSVDGEPARQFMFQRAGVPGMMITTAATNPERIIQWYDWAMTAEGSMFNWLGIEGEDWRMANGEVEILDATRTPFYSYVPTVTSYVAEATEMTQFGDEKVAIIEQAHDNIYFGPDSLGMPNSVYDGYEDFIPSVAALYRETASRMVTGEISMDEWDEYVEQWYSEGGRAVTDRATEWYRETHNL